MSLDLCNKYISEKIRDDIKINLEYIKELKDRFSDRIDFVSGEPFHLTVKGYNGNIFSECLREKNTECEYSDFEYTVLLMSPVNIKKDYEILSDAFEYAVMKTPKNENIYPIIPKAVKKMSIRDAVFAESENISIEKSEGRICAETNIPCPPAIPIAISGEVITDEIINIYKRYGIFTVNVVK